jgi:hypothetical protein
MNDRFLINKTFGKAKYSVIVLALYLKAFDSYF